MKIDFGSGHNPRPGYLTCDPFYERTDVAYDVVSYHIDVPDGSVDIIHCRNVLHHVRDLDRLFNEFFRVLRPNGYIMVVEPRRASFKANVMLDQLWYRFLTPRPEVWFAKRYRDYTAIAKKHGFYLRKYRMRKEKEISVLTRNPNRSSSNERPSSKRTGREGLRLRSSRRYQRRS